MQEIALKDENLILVVAKIIFNIFFKFSFLSFPVLLFLGCENYDSALLLATSSFLSFPP